MLSIACSACPAGSPTATLSRDVQILRDLAAQVHGVTRDHALAQVVVEVLLGVGVAGVEGAQADVPAGDDAIGHAVLPVVMSAFM